MLIDGLGQSVKFEPWHYFLSLERAYQETTDYVEPCAANFTAYSNRFASLLLAIGSEVDVIAQHLCKQINPNSKASKIKAYQQEITGAFAAIHTIEIPISRYQLKLQPWRAWAKPDTSPPWWRSYNRVKHNRLEKVREANLENVLNALAGLMALHLYIYRDDHLQPYAALLEYNFPSYLVDEGGQRPPGA